MNKFALKSVLMLALSVSTVFSGAFAADGDNKWGFVNAVGKVVIKPEYLEAKPFSGGLAAVKQKAESGSELWGFIDKHGKVVIAPQFQEVGGFAFGLAPVRLPDTGALVDKYGSGSGGKWGYIDQDGKFVIEPHFEVADVFSEGLAAAAQDGKYGFIDKSGKWFIAPSFYLACRFVSGRAAVLTLGNSHMISISTEDNIYRCEGGHWGYVDTTGKEVIPCMLESCGSFGKNLAPAAVGLPQGMARTDRWGFINPEGKYVIEPSFADVRPMTEGKAAVQSGTYFDMGKGVRSFVPGKWGYINDQGKQIIDAKYDGADPFSEGMAAVKVGNRWGYIDTTGKVVIPPHFIGNLAFSEELAPVIVDPAEPQVEK